MACYTYEKEIINLRTGKTEWVEVPDAPLTACPSCCEPKGKLLRRTVLSVDDCSVAFMGPDMRSYRKRTERHYADGSCGITVQYTYDLPCSPETQQIIIAREVLPGLCNAVVEFQDAVGNIYSYNVVSLSETFYLPLGTYKVRVLRSGCLDALQLKTLVSETLAGSVVWDWGQAPQTVLINESVIGFKVVYAGYASS